MKKILILLLVALGFFAAACNNNKTSKNKNSDNREKDDYGKRDNKNREEDDGNKWSAMDRNKYTRQCLDEASSKDMNDELAEKICSCSLDKMEKTFSSYADADGTSSNASVIASSIKECVVEVSGNNINTTRTEGWSQADENKFVDECAGEATKNVGASRAKQYCDCMLQKIKKMYPNYDEANRKLASTSQEDINAMAADCNKE